MSLPLPRPEDLLRIAAHVVGGTDLAEYLPLLEEELALRGDDRRAPQWHKADLAPDTEFRVAVIGAGMSGLLTAYRLTQAGVDVVVLEKNPEVGGTWYENQYPGCRVDNPNHNYSYSFAQRHDWPLHFSTQDVLLDYFRDCAREFGVHDRIRFETEVVSATWHDDDATWTLVVRNDRRDRGHGDRAGGRRARSGSSTARTTPTSPGARPSPAPRSTPPAGTTTRRSTAHASR